MSDHNVPREGVVMSIPMFSGQPMHEYFCQMAQLAPSTTMAASSTRTSGLPVTPMDLPDVYEFDGERRDVEAFLGETDTSALLVLQDGRVRYERYELTGGPSVPWISMSVAKSFISALVGIAHAEGSIADLDGPISAYIGTAVGSAMTVSRSAMSCRCRRAPAGTRTTATPIRTSSG